MLGYRLVVIPRTADAQEGHICQLLPPADDVFGQALSFDREYAAFDRYGTGSVTLDLSSVRQPKEIVSVTAARGECHLLGEVNRIRSRVDTGRPVDISRVVPSGLAPFACDVRDGQLAQATGITILHRRRGRISDGLSEFDTVAECGKRSGKG